MVSLVVWEWRREQRALAEEVKWLRRSVLLLGVTVILLGAACSMLGLAMLRERGPAAAGAATQTTK